MAVEIIGAAAKKRWSQKFPGSPAVRTLCSHCRRPGFNPWLENWDPTSHSAGQKTNKQKSSLGWKYPQIMTLPFAKILETTAHHSSSCSISLGCFLIFVSFPLVLDLVLPDPKLTICTLPNPLRYHWSRTKERKWQYLQPFPTTVSCLCAWLPHWRKSHHWPDCPALSSMHALFQGSVRDSMSLL